VTLLEELVAGKFADQPQHVRDELRVIVNDPLMEEDERVSRANTVIANGGKPNAGRGTTKGLTAKRHTPDDDARYERVSRFCDASYTSRQIKDMPPPEWLVDGILVRGGVAFLVGKWGVGKSFYAVDLALSVALGVPFHGHHVRKGHVVYICAEGAAGLGGRIEAWEQHHSIEDEHGDISWLTVPVNFHDSAAVGALLLYLLGAQPELVIVDTLNRCSVGADENSAKDAGLIVEQITRVANEMHAAVVLLHHPGKDATKGGRGSSAFVAAIDTEITMTGDDYTTTVTITKQRHGPDGAVYRYRRVAIGDSCILEDAGGWTEDLQMQALHSLDALREIYSDTPVTSSAWRDAVGKSSATIARHAKLLLEKDMIRNVGSKFHPRYLPIREDGTWPNF
jgi:hypothetical protein